MKKNLLAKKYLVIFILIIFSVSIGKSQNLEWANPLEPHTSTGSSAGYDVAVDNAGNVYLAGFMNGDYDADPGPGVTMIYSGTLMNAFLCKYNSSGSLAWVFTIGSTTNPPGHVNFFSVTCDQAGDVVVCGIIELGGVADFDPGPGTFNMSANVFIAKYSSAGNLIWAISPVINRIFSNSRLLQASIKTDKANNIYITGFFSGSSDFDPGPDTCTFVTTSGNCTDVFLAKYSSAGAFCWAKQFGNTSCDFGVALDLDDSANVYFAGTFASLSIDFDAGPNTNILSSNTPFTPFVAKYDSAGNHIWAFAIGPFGAVSSWAHVTDLEADHNGDVYVSGILTGTADFDPGPGTANLSTPHNGFNGYYDYSFLAKYSTSGNYLWAFVLPSNESNNGYNGFGIGIDANNDLIAGGFFKGTVDFDPGAGVSALTSNTNNNADAYIAKFSTQGNYIWAFSVSGSTGGANAFSTTTDSAGAFYVCGGYTGHADFDPGVLVYDLYSAGPGGNAGAQAFVAKYRSNSTVNVNEIDNSISEFNVSPNPFSGETEISFNLLSEEKTILKIHDIHGRIIKNIQAENFKRGINKFVWDATNNSGYKIEKGIYFITVRGGAFNQTKKVVIMGM